MAQAKWTWDPVGTRRQEGRNGKEEGLREAVPWWGHCTLRWRPRTDSCNSLKMRVRRKGKCTCKCSSRDAWGNPAQRHFSEAFAFSSPKKSLAASSLNLNPTRKPQTTPLPVSSTAIGVGLGVAVFRALLVPESRVLQEAAQLKPIQCSSNAWAESCRSPHRTKKNCRCQIEVLNPNSSSLSNAARQEFVCVDAFCTSLLCSARYRYHENLQLKVSVVRVRTPVSVSAKYSRGTEWNHIFAAGESVVPILARTVPGQSFTAFVYASHMTWTRSANLFSSCFVERPSIWYLKVFDQNFPPWLTYFASATWASYGVSKRARNNSSSDRGTLHYINKMQYNQQKTPKVSRKKQTNQKIRPRSLT